MSAIYTFDVFSTLDGFGSPKPGTWGGYWGKQGRELLEHRAAIYGEEQRMVLGANTYKMFAHFMALSAGKPDTFDPWAIEMLNKPTTVISNTLQSPADSPSTTIANGNAVDIITRLKKESTIPLRSHGSLSLNRALMAAGLVDRIQVTLFPVITGQSGGKSVFQDAADFDLKLIDSRTLDGNIQELTYVPTRHV